MMERKCFPGLFFISNEKSLKCSALLGIQFYFNDMKHLEVSLP